MKHKTQDDSETLRAAGKHTHTARHSDTHVTLRHSETHLETSSPRLTFSEDVKFQLVCNHAMALVVL